MSFTSIMAKLKMANIPISNVTSVLSFTMGNFLQIHFLSLSFDIAIIEEIPSEVEGLKEEEGTNQKKLGSTVLCSE